MTPEQQQVIEAATEARLLDAPVMTVEQKDDGWIITLYNGRQINWRHATEADIASATPRRKRVS